ncbi:MULTISPECIES: antibiotic biosynthesis monooxygenase [unclassified Coleofasciculus]|uniref:antibiotic biosynthesis monooxygenase n=1 Tax=unclassified Coleofasciculus TaxID=2692782 RepID=UPI0018824BEB|nr:MULTISPECIES: antibiotic biosynthesis monooxygenase [unclassified Coleofasciculus]MBE9124922.1 antibiotic biosynthesis monooxygenase [Coleofasciculus sp. LEGE 07081]MBE9147833.1 antibiotic biosynthesis monooxygenase [Coleofasciculus sp. LEGE 07092]
MTEFMDFLKHKFAYIAIGEFKPGKFEEAQQLYEKAVSTYSQGFQGAYLLREPGTDKGIAVIFWEDIADMDANQSEAYEEVLKQMSHLFFHPPITSFYEVSSEIQPLTVTSEE